MISVLLPSRKRLPLLIRCIKSIADNASSHDAFEICLRIHRDDLETIKELPYVLSLCTVRVVIGLQHGGYGDLSWFYQEAAAIARGDWVWVMNDNVVCDTRGWDLLIPSEVRDVVIQPENHRLGGSTYEFDTTNPFMFVPNKSWEKCGHKRFGTPFDHSLWTLLREHGYPTEFIPIDVHHDHDPAKNAAERADEKSVRFDADPHEHHMENC